MEDIQQHFDSILLQVDDIEQHFNAAGLLLSQFLKKNIAIQKRVAELEQQLAEVTKQIHERPPFNYESGDK